jgi:hypothetical protein
MGRKAWMGGWRAQGLDEGLGGGGGGAAKKIKKKLKKKKKKKI